MAPSNRVSLAWRKTLPAGIPIVVGFLLFSSTGRDDSHITYWAAHMLSTRGEIVNYNGERVEQSSSLTHVVLLAALEKIVPLPLPTIGAFVSIAGGGLAVAVTQNLAAVVCPRISLLAGLLAAFSSSLIYWSFSGLETTLAAALGAGSLLMFAQYLRNRWRPIAILSMCSLVSLYLLVRPESIAVIASVLLGGSCLLWCRVTFFTHEDAGHCKDVLWRLLALLGIAVALFGAIVFFRLYYFGDSFPQPVDAKTPGLSRIVLHDGITYLAWQIWSGWGLALWTLAACGVALVVYRTLTAPRFSAPEMLVALFILAYTAFVILAGGDWMEGGRFLVPMLPMIVIMALRYVQHAAPHRLVTAGMLLLCLQIGGTLALVKYGSTGDPLWVTWRSNSGTVASVSWFDTANNVRRGYLRLVPTVDEVIRTLLRRQVSSVTFMSCQMGTMPYYLGLAHFGRLRFIDTCALASRDFTTCPVTDWLPRNRYGLRLNLEFFFRHRQQLWDRCKIPDPDIIFEFDQTMRLADGSIASNRKFLGENGYTIVYQQPSAWFVALRSDLMNALTGVDLPLRAPNYRLDTSITGS